LKDISSSAVLIHNIFLHRGLNYSTDYFGEDGKDDKKTNIVRPAQSGQYRSASPSGIHAKEDVGGALFTFEQCRIPLLSSLNSLKLPRFPCG
jgi:hypothetical protein